MIPVTPINHCIISCRPLPSAGYAPRRLGNAQDACRFGPGGRLLIADCEFPALHHTMRFRGTSGTLASTLVVLAHLRSTSLCACRMVHSLHLSWRRANSSWSGNADYGHLEVVARALEETSNEASRACLNDTLTPWTFPMTFHPGYLVHWQGQQELSGLIPSPDAINKHSKLNPLLPLQAAEAASVEIDNRSRTTQHSIAP